MLGNEKVVQGSSSGARGFAKDAAAGRGAGVRFDLRQGDSRDELKLLGSVHVDALVTDPPAGISFMGKTWDHDHGGREGWIEIMASIFAECLRVLKPGAHGLVWAIPRTSHWTATALEDAGFEIRDVGVHIFGTGFPKSLNVSKAIEKEWFVKTGRLECPTARAWAGWGTALKPASEHWILCRKPLDGTVAETVLRHGTGAINVDACRIGVADDEPNRRTTPSVADPVRSMFGISGHAGTLAQGRWPSNVTLDEEAAALLDEQSGELTSGIAHVLRRGGTTGRGLGYGSSAAGDVDGAALYGDTGGASRFFYVAKPDRAERDIGCEDLAPVSGGEATARVDGTAGLQNPRAGAGRNGGARNIHPTVKSVDLMRWLCRLITPKGGLVLDPFMGSGSTGVACSREGLRFIGIERERAYFEIARRRICGDAPLLNSHLLRLDPEAA